jgi:hypothetical protein
VSTPIQYPAFPANVPLCSTTDVSAVLFSLTPTVDATLMSNAIAAAKTSLEQRTNRILTPKRIQRRLDGNGKDRMVLPEFPILVLNEVQVYYTYPLGLTRKAHEWDFIISRNTGVISFPPYAYSVATQPFAFTFYPSSKNVLVDYTVGFTEQLFGDLLSSEDHTTFAFSYPAVKQAINVVPDTSTAPQFTPTIYVNGVAQTNTTYVNTDTANGGWQVETDNLVYRLNQNAAGGYSGVTFNTPLQPSDVVTADYSYWFIPADLKDAAAKQAAITVLSAIAVAPYGDASTGGMTSVQMDGFRTQANDKGQWGPQIQQWSDEIDAVVQSYRQITFPTTSGYSSDNGGLW